MKRHIVITGIILSLAACQTEIDMHEEDEYGKENIEQMIIAPEIIATQEAETPSKSVLSVDGEGIGTIYWTPADEINVFYGTTSTHYYSQNASNATTASFTTSDEISSGDAASNNIWGLYPYNSSATCDGTAVTTSLPATQYGVPGTFDEDLFITLAHNASTDLQFYNVCGGIKFSLSRNDITRITFRGNDNEDIAGDISISFVNDLPDISIVNGLKQITLTPKTGNTFASGTNYYLVILPTTLSSGFTMSFETETEVGVFNYTTKPIIIKRSVISTKANINTYASFDLIEIPEGPVDLGLSVLWASQNLGAEDPTDYGDYYAWGETNTYYSEGYAQENPQQHWLQGKSSGYSWASYSLSYSGNSYSFAKYCNDDDYGIVDNKTTLELIDDAAHRWLGGKWRMPTNAEWSELNHKCSIKEVSYNGIQGYKIKSKVSGYTDNWIFLPKSGFRSGTTISFLTSSGYYWSSTVNGIPEYAHAYYGPTLGFIASSRNHGYSIRPVYDTSIADTVTDLSAEGTANCYIVSTSGYYRFKAVQGNTNTSVGSVAEIQVLWESFGNNVSPNVGDIVKLDYYSNGYIYFNTVPYRKGNALIAALNSSGTILWSWHIWCTDQPASQDYYRNDKPSVKVGTMMDRNLGATSVTPGEVQALGLLYQWGRKDPFLSGNSINSNYYASATIPGHDQVACSYSTGQINYAIQHPTTFIKGCNNTYDWLYSSNPSSATPENTRWRSIKTQYDPCPPGWKVPSGGNDGIWASAFDTSNNWTKASNWDSTHMGMNLGSTDKYLGLNKGESIWYPAAGTIYHLGGESYNGMYLMNVGGVGWYWSYSPASNHHSYSLYFTNTGIISPANASGSKADAMSVRCQKI